MTTATATETPAATVTRQDILNARQDYEDHLGECGCRIGACAERTALWLAWMDAAGRWGQPREGGASA